MMLTLPNILSLLRAPLALMFLSENVFYRTAALLIAMLTDGLDGSLARRHGTTSKFGTILDPIMDKFFVLFVLGIFIGEGRLTVWEAGAFICRDFSVIVYGIYLAVTCQLANYQFKSIYCGKLTTFFQFLVLLALTLGFTVPRFSFSIFIALGLMALVELALSKEQTKSIPDQPT